MASILERAVSLVRPGIDAKAFYFGKTLSQVEWWISSCCEFPELYWGRLRVFSDGTVDAAFDEEDVYGFDDREYSGCFLAEDEYIRFSRLDAEDEAKLGAKACDLTPPTWSDTPKRFHYLATY